MSISTIPRVLIVNCNAGDQEMDHLSLCVKQAETAKKQNCTLITYDDLKSINNEQYKKLILVSHSSFYTPDEKPKSLKNRKIGNYNLSDIAEKVCQLIIKNKVSEVQFLGCEMALNVDTRRMGLQADLAEINFNKSKFKSVIQCLKMGKHEKISTLTYISTAVFKELSDAFNDKKVTLRGMTGVGYISTNAIPRSFDRAHLKELNALINLKKEIDKETGDKKKRNLQDKLKEREREFMSSRVDKFDSPVQFEMHITI